MNSWMNIPIVYEDDSLLIVDKPSGLLTVPTPKNEKRTLTSILGLYPCHRLDRDTSGLIIYAKSKPVQQNMMGQFRERLVKKTYIAFIRGIPSSLQGIIKGRIDGLFAQTCYKVIEKKMDFAIVEVTPLTGRTNQIRIHFKSIGHPILGESKYAFRRDFKIKAKRLCLHSAKLEFKHPKNGKIMRLEINLAQDLKTFLEENV
ncbi:MAG: RluA family pseudouridine synthase [Candidatus Omnitrophota bacterium]|jgi:RluA family pseudouridine synthase